MRTSQHRKARIPSHWAAAPLAPLLQPLEGALIVRELDELKAEKLLADRLTGDEGSRLIDNSIEDIPRKLQ